MERRTFLKIAPAAAGAVAAVAFGRFGIPAIEDALTQSKEQKPTPIKYLRQIDGDNVVAMNGNIDQVLEQLRVAGKVQPPTTPTLGLRDEEEASFEIPGRGFTKFTIRKGITTPASFEDGLKPDKTRRDYTYQTQHGNESRVSYTFTFIDDKFEAVQMLVQNAKDPVPFLTGGVDGRFETKDTWKVEGRGLIDAYNAFVPLHNAKANKA